MKFLTQRVMKHRYFTLATTLILLLLSTYTQATNTDLWRESGNKAAKIEHGDWQKILNNYIEPRETHPGKPAINFFRYKDISTDDKKVLTRYLVYLQGLDPREYNKAEQFAYWVNLYNALTVDLILTNYPVKSITKLGSLFSFGPWDKDVIKIAGETLTLNDIEHKILRPIWNDPRIHYAVNCASVGCPNLSTKAFTADNTEALLEQAAKDYINHPRGLTYSAKKLTLSKIYQWYAEDFGDSESHLLSHIAKYAEPGLAQKLKTFNGKISYEYDWSLNEPKVLGTVRKP